MSSFTASALANGSSQTSTVPSTTVTATATASATSNISQEDAQTLANTTALNVANSAAQNDANIISQSLNLSPAGLKGTYSNYNVEYIVNYKEQPNFLTYIYTDISNNISLNVQLDKNIYNNAVNPTLIGSTLYTINFRCPVPELLEGTYNTLDIVYDSTKDCNYYIYRSGYLNQFLNKPLKSNNYNNNLVNSYEFVTNIVDSVEIKNLTTKKRTTFTNVGIQCPTSSNPPYSTRYSINFDNAILTSTN